METKINVAEILKDKPQGTKLYSSACGKCELKEADDKSFKVSFYSSKFGFMNGGEGIFDKNGNLYDDGECIIFPSREMRDWSKFNWKKGDVLVSNDGKIEVIFEKFRDDTYQSFIGRHHLESIDENLYYQDGGEYPTFNFNIETEDAALTYINTIEERLGGKLNRKTLEIEEAQPEFMDGDIAFADYGNRQDVFIVSDKTDLSEGYSSFISLDLSSLTLSMGCRTSFFKKDLCKLRLATEEEKQQLFDALAKKGKTWDAEKKEVVDLKPKVELKPFDKVLVRDDETSEWKANFYSQMGAFGGYECISGVWGDCIPYEGNEHLLGTTDNFE